MAKSLVIVESPAKAKTINRYLGNDYIVKSSVGHIRDLPTSGSGAPADPKARAAEAAKTRKMSPDKRAAYKKKKARDQLVARMGIDPEGGWDARYEVLPGKEKVVKELRQAAERADTVYLATDRDREGEAIAWHLQQAIGGEPSRYKRVVFNEITKRAIDAAFAEPGEVDVDRVNAQQARRFLDRVVGYMVSPLLWSKVARGLSAGRVQSVAVRLIVEREREIRAFVPEEYWEVFANLARDEQVGEVVRARFQVAKRAGENFRPGSEEDRGSRGPPHIDQARRSVHHVDAPAGGEYAPGFQREEDHDPRPATLRGGSHHLHADGLHEPFRGRRGGLPGPGAQGLR
jgi:DNA topoisomerase-1